jgi:holo-[acyl-carrier protein] synthase
MDIVGHGIDVVDIETISGLLADEDDFLNRCYTDKEKSSVVGSVNSVQRLAGKFAAKEAVAKALGTGFDGAVSPSEIEVMNTTNGRPMVILRGESATIAAQLNISRWLVSISHSETSAFASAIALAAPSR